MANYAMWNMRLRHEWLQKPGKARRLKRCQRVRVGLQAALDRRAGKASTSGASEG
jgi:hypothetical protein